MAKNLTMSSSASGAIFQLNFIYGAEKRVCQLTHKVFDLPLASVYPLYVTKVSRKDRTEAELIKVITWLTGFDSRTLKSHLKNETSLRDFFKYAKINPNAKLITGSICGVKIDEIEDPLMKKIRYLDKLVDELAKGRPMEKILRSGV